MLTSAQCRAARALLDWSRDKLAEEATIGLRTLVDFERGARDPRHATLEVLRRTLEKAGVAFLDNGETIEGGPGVRLRHRQDGEGMRPDELSAENDG